MTDDRFAALALVEMLDGSVFTNANRRSGKPCRIQLPHDPQSRMALVRAHICGAPATLTFQADGQNPWRERVDAVELAGFCPDSNGRCHWVGIDLDAVDHGERGLVDPIHATRALAERADAAGLASGLIVARSRRGRGRHVLLMLPAPTVLSDAVIGVAALVAAAFHIAASDVMAFGGGHAFLCANDDIAQPGDAGAVELLPRSTKRPAYGWALALPAAGATRSHGGGVIVHPFEDRPIRLQHVPRCDAAAWRCFVAENRRALDRVRRSKSRPYSRYIDLPRLHRLHPLIDEFLAGRTPAGQRNATAFAVACSLIRNGLPLHDVEQQVLQGARVCELPEREARGVIRSALRAVERSG